MKKILLVSMLMLTYLVTLKAQDKYTTFYENKNEVGINATYLIGNLLSLSNNTNTPYAAMYTRHLKTSNIRCSLDIFSENSSDFSNGFNKSITDMGVSLRVGVEKNKPLSNRFMMHYGIDVLSNYSSNYSTTDNFFSNDIKTLSLGAGPALRMVYKLHKNIYFMTESTMYGLYGFKQNTEILNGMQSRRNSDFYSFKLTMPTSLYISLHF